MQFFGMPKQSYSPQSKYLQGLWVGNLVVFTLQHWQVNLKAYFPWFQNQRYNKYLSTCIFSMALLLSILAKIGKMGAINNCSEIRWSYVASISNNMCQCLYAWWNTSLSRCMCIFYYLFRLWWSVSESFHMVIVIIVLIVAVLSGVLSTARNLDRETNAQYSLQITATDGRGKASYN